MFGSLEILYLFLGGTGAGLCLTASTLGLFSPKEALCVEGRRTANGRICRYVLPPAAYRHLLSPPLIVSAVLIGVGSLCLLCSLGRPEQVLALFCSSSFVWGNFGAWSLLLCMGLAFVQVAIVNGCAKCPLLLFRAVNVLSVVASFSVALYTGFLLYSMTGSPFWRTPFLPALFVLSSFTCGIGALSFIAVAFRLTVQFSTLIESVLRVDLFVVLAEALAAACFVLVRPSAGDGAAAVQASLASLLTGECAFAFWVLFVGLGLVVPFALELGIRFKHVPVFEYVLVVLGAAALTGGAALRYCVVLSATHPFLGTALEIAL